LTIILSFLLLPFVFQAVGGLSGIRETIQDPKMLSLVVPGKIGLFFVIMYAIQALVGRTLKFDPDRETIIDDEEATSMLTRKYRAGGHWSVPSEV